jgi:hypothetical protein
LLWFGFTGAGAVYSLFQPAGRSAGNAFAFGGFICAGFEFLVINGVFIERSSISMLLSAVHPFVTAVALTVVGAALPDGPALALGFVVFVVIASFTVALKRRKTSRGYNAVSFRPGDDNRGALVESHSVVQGTQVPARRGRHIRHPAWRASWSLPSCGKLQPARSSLRLV